MKVLIEEYPYAFKDVEQALDGLFTLKDRKGNLSVSYVGYYYNPKIREVVFILPKVLINEKGRVFGLKDDAESGYDPRDIIDIDNARLKPHEVRFIYEFSVWIHRSIVVYDDTHAENEIVLCEQMESEGPGAKKKSNTWLDVILSLIRFAKENKSFFTFVLRNMHSGYNKINWTRTISGTPAHMQDESPVYLNPVNKKRQINFDEELIVIFFSILNYISGRYGFKTEIPFGFDLIKGGKFERYLNGYGCHRLRLIKYKYFSDVAMRLWNLCYAFFDKTYRINTATTQREYLLAKSFHIVFEAMIDELIGDRDEDIPAGLKDQTDGKLIDHFYTYPGLLINREKENDIYYIGDSKYYKIGSEPGPNSVFKQYTYARNVIQWNLNLYYPERDETEEERRKRLADKGRFALSNPLRDEVTEGYNPIPNFFISANIDPATLTYDSWVTQHKDKTYVSRQFENRLYDRDTLIVSHYDVNFLYVLRLYARNHAGEKSAYKTEVRRQFRREIQDLLKRKFNFYVMAAHPDVDGIKWMQENFRSVLGKTFSPFLDRNVFSLALDDNPKFRADNERLLAELRKNFYVVRCELGNEPYAALDKNRAVVGDVTSPTAERGTYLTTCIVRPEQGAEGNKTIRETYSRFASEEAAGITYVQMRMPQSGSVDGIRYLLPICDGEIRGFYDIDSVTFGTRPKQLSDGQSYQLPVLKLKLGEYHRFETPCTVGINLAAMSNQLWNRAQLERLKQKSVDASGGYTAEEPAFAYGAGADIDEDAGYIES